MLPEGEPVPEKEEEGQMEVDGKNENQESEAGNEESHEKMEETEEGKTEELDPNRGRKRKRENEEDKEGERVEHVNQESEETEEVTGEEQRQNAGSEIVKSLLCFFLFNFVLLTRAKMLSSGELVPENGHTDEEEEEGLDGQDVNQDSEVADETGEETGEEQRENAGSENDENPSGLVVEDDEEERRRRRRRAAEKGKQPMSDQGGGLSITESNDESNYEDEEDSHLDLAILKAMCSTRNTSYNQRLQFVKDSFPDLKISIKNLERKVIRLENSFNDIRELHGDDPEMVRPIDREIFDLSMIIWGQR